MSANGLDRGLILHLILVDWAAVLTESAIGQGLLCKRLNEVFALPEAFSNVQMICKRREQFGGQLALTLHRMRRLLGGRRSFSMRKV